MAKFPLDKKQCKQWVKATGNEDLVYVPIEKLHTLKYICGNHFENKYFNKNKTRLKKFAIPSKELKANPLHNSIFKNFPYHISNEQLSDSQNHSSTEISTLHAETPSSVHHLAIDMPSTSFDHSTTLKKRKPTKERQWSSKPTHNDHSYCLPQITPESRKRKLEHLSDLNITPRKKKLLRKLDKCKQKIRFLKVANVMDNIDSVALKGLIRAFVRNKGKKPQGNRWTAIEKALAVAIYKKSPRTYRYLKHVIALPSIRTLQSLLQNIELEPGHSDTVLEHMKKKVIKLNERERVCALLFDEITLKRRLFYNSRTDKVEGFVDLGNNQYRSKEIADHALVFMLQGIYKKLKQPVAYYFVKGTISSQSLAVLIKTVIKALTDIGYIILTTVCDQGPTNIGSLNFLKKNVGLPTDLNYFMLDGMKIFMFDIPHLFKSIRNNFYQGGELVLDEHNAKWSHLIELEEKNKSTLHFKKITALHVNPKFRSKMKVKLAVQVLSNTVAAILKLLAETYADGQKRQEVLETARIVEDLDRLFDCTNGPASRNDIKKHRRENVSKKTNHIVLWNKYKSKIKSMHFIKSDSRLRLKNVRCVQGYLTSLCSLEDIWKFVESKGFKYLNLRQLNQDALENLFGMIRQHCPTNRNPTCHHFTAALKSNILTKLSTPVSRGGNCEEDNNVALIDFEDFLQPISQGNNERVTELSQLRCSTDRETFPMLHLEEEEDIEELEREETLFTSFEKQPTVYVAGYLASVVLKKIHWQCDGCTLCFTIEHPEQKPELYNYIALREWWNDKKSLTYPTLHLCKLIDCASLCFEELIKPNLQEINISERTVTMMLANFDNLSWVCTEHKDKLLEVLLLRLAHLLIRNECNRTNFTFATAEEHVADVNKKAQQQGIAK